MTSNGAALLGLAAEVGAVAPGFRADLVSLDADPLSDLRARHDVRAVMKDGRVVAPLRLPA